MPRVIRSQIADEQKRLEEEKTAEEKRKVVRIKLEELDLKLNEAKEKLLKADKSLEEAKQELSDFSEKESQVFGELEAERKEKRSKLEELSEERENTRISLEELNTEREKIQKEINADNKSASPNFTRKIRSVSSSSNETKNLDSPVYNKALAVAENPAQGKVKVGDYVSYVGDYDSKTTEWRIWEITPQGIIITPQIHCHSRKLQLLGRTDYERVTRLAPSVADIKDYYGTDRFLFMTMDKITSVCRGWYKNNELGVTEKNIRSMAIEDLNEASRYLVPESSERYAYYLNDVDETEKVTFKGKTYQKIKHRSMLYSKSSLPKPMFLRGKVDGGAQEGFLMYNGIGYQTPTETEPVYISDTSYFYNPSKYCHKDNPSVTVGELLGWWGGWLASTCVKLDPKKNFAEFSMRIASGLGVDSIPLLNSLGEEENFSASLHPLVLLDSTIKIVKGYGTRGSPWRLGKEL